MVLSPLKLRKRQSRARNGLSGYEWFGLVMISSNGYEWFEWLRLVETNYI